MNNDLNFPPIFERLDLGCIDADCCRCIFIGGLLARSTRFTYFCAAQIYKFQLKIANIFPRLNIEFLIFFLRELSPARWGHPGGCPPAGPASNVVSGKVEKIRENKEHLVPGPFT